MTSYIWAQYLGTLLIYHPLYGMNTPYMGVIFYHVTLSEEGNKDNKETLVPHLVATLIYLSQNYSYYIRGDRSPLNASLYR